MMLEVGALLFLIVVALLVLFWAYEEPQTQQDYGVQSVTQRGEEVRSVAERRIANYFARNKISYVYEREARGKGFLFDYKISSPDFYLPDYDVYVEYWGLVDADHGPTRVEYVRNMKWKMALYYKNNIKFISIYPDNLQNLDWIFRRKFKTVTGFELPS